MSAREEKRGAIMGREFLLSPIISLGIFILSILLFLTGGFREEFLEFVCGISYIVKEALTNCFLFGDGFWI